MSLCNDTTSTMLVTPATTCNTGNGMGWGGDWASYILLFLIFGIFGFGGGGWGGFGGGAGNGALTRGELCQDMNFSDLESAVGRLSDNQALQFTQLNNGLCQLGYREAELASGINMNLAAGFANNATQLCQLGNNIANQFHAGQIAQLQGQNAIQAQLSDCCCTTQRAIDGINYNMATQACQTRQTINDAVRSLHDEIVANRLEDKNAIIAAQNQQLFAAQLAASQSEQTNALISRLSPCPIPAYPACPTSYQWQTVNSGCNCG